MPAARPATLTDADSAAGALPLAGETASQVWSSDAVKLSEPPPLFVTFTVCAAGFAPPAVAVNDRLAGETASTGVGGIDVERHGDRLRRARRARGGDRDGARVGARGRGPAMSTETVSVAGAVPLAGETLSQDRSRTP